MSRPRKNANQKAEKRCWNSDSLEIPEYGTTSTVREPACGYNNTCRMTGERLRLQIKNLNDQGPLGKTLMSTTSTRAQAIAEILWQLKRAEKLATLTSIAARAGFSPGANGRTVSTCLKTVRRDWPHLQWWRAVADNGQLDDEQKSLLAKAGFETETVDGGTVVIKSFATQLMSWDEPEEQANDDNVAASDGGRAVKVR